MPLSAAGRFLKQESMKLFTWNPADWTGHYGGPKAKRDVHTILAAARLGSPKWDVITLPLDEPFPPRSGTDDDEIAFLQHPLREFISSNTMPDVDRIDRFARGWAARWKRRIVFVHDIKQYQATIFKPGLSLADHSHLAKAERQILRSATALIVQTSAMENYIRMHHSLPHLKYYHLNLFDYISDKLEKTLASQDHKLSIIAYCGNLHKSSLSTELVDDLPVDPRFAYHFFGLGSEQCERSDINIHGLVAAEKLPNILLSKGCEFGLCWWAKEIRDSKYLDLVSPHKASCYLAAGLPLICPRHSYLGQFVLATKAGLAIDSLLDLPAAVLSIGLDQKQLMRRRAECLSLLVRRGHFTTRAMSGALA
jgi:hypothetical protein